MPNHFKTHFKLFITIKCVQPNRYQMSYYIVHTGEKPNIKDKDKDKEALFNVAYNVTDNISS